MSKKPIIVFEGIEGSGKSHHINKVSKYLDKKEKKWKSFSKLEKEEDKNLPDYIFQNKKKFKDWIEI